VKRFAESSVVRKLTINMIITRLLVPPLLFGLVSVWVACKEPEQSQQNVKSKRQSKNEITPDEPARNILFFGNSLTAGYGVEPEDAFPYIIQKQLDSLVLPYQVINAGLSGETTAGGVGRIEWVLREPVAIMILELGGNDGLRGIDPGESMKNLQEIIDLAQAKYSDIQIIISGMEAPPNMGQEYVTVFRSIFRELSQVNDLPLIPFLLEGVGGEPELNLPDGIHPNERGHKIVAENVWAVLKNLVTEG
jgi:acyl-CoA thioesterase-1